MRGLRGLLLLDKMEATYGKSQKEKVSYQENELLKKEIKNEMETQIVLKEKTRLEEQKKIKNRIQKQKRRLMFGLESIA